jgi:hypothetical protein
MRSLLGQMWFAGHSQLHMNIEVASSSDAQSLKDVRFCLQTKRKAGFFTLVFPSSILP